MDTTLFVKVLIDNLVELMPVVYTPTVGTACLRWDRNRKTHTGMYVSYFEHRGKVRSVLDNWKFSVDIIVVTDGGRILGLGDLGTNGMGIPIGKIALYVAGAGFHPTHSLPVQLDCGTDNEEYLNSDFYLGAKQKRISAEEHTSFLDEFCTAVKEKWPQCLIQFEDFATDRAFPLLNAMRDRCLCFNDDIQGTGSVVLAGFMNGMKAQGTSLADAKVIFFGAGSAACGVAIQLTELFVSEGMPVEEARMHIYMFDQKGLLTTTRGDVIPEYSLPFARSDGVADTADLVELINAVQPHALFGLSGAGPLFGQDVIEAMCASTERPLIFPLSNPTSKAEITAENAYTWSDGKCIFAAGSPFAPVEYNGQTFVPGQGNNVFIFPGVGFGAWLVRSKAVKDAFFLEAAKELASYVTDEELAQGKIYPAIANLREVSRNVAARTAEVAYAMGLATRSPKPDDLCAFVEQAMYVPSYANVEAEVEKFPAEDYKHLVVPQISRGIAFTFEERRELGIDGLLPSVVQSIEMQKARFEGMLREETDNLKKYMILSHLLAFNTVLFYKVLVDNLVELMPVVYTPTVGAACLRWDRNKRTHCGMYISYFEHRGRVRSVLDNWNFDVDIIVVTDGGRILGLGDLGTNGMGIPIGKIALYVAGGGFHPIHSLPVQLDTGTDNEELLTNDEFYLGARQNRISEGEHASFLDEFCMAVKDKWPHCLIQFEDFATNRAFSLLSAMRSKCLCFNDDIQGTGSVVLAGFMNGMKAQGTALADARVIFFGAGSAACGVALQIVELFVSEGISEEEARTHIYMFDQKGLLTTTRGDELPAFNQPFARSDGIADTDQLVELINTVKPHALFGLSGAGPMFGQDVIESMCASTERPLIFPLSNPTSKAEITAENAYVWSNGKCIFAAGSPFAPVEFNGQMFVPGQGNNVFIFPGVGFGAWIVQSTAVSDTFFLEAAKELASYVTAEQLDQGRIYPSIANLREVSLNVAARTAECAYKMGLAMLKPKPNDLRAFIQEAMYVPEYDA
eukprot:TRINITY_DN15564_c0_g1_i1.p1 TRINITY_DN15564_c0_g1~~TRINITY_DN15564_c0_g1_i1.p1  ORF type:complete len:1142 (-),score=177.17 TRINITY_DN15564_c0_g1_i1:55-3123(-)